MKTVIRPEIEMKNSGIEWIGNIPKDWKIAPIKVNFNVYAGATPSGNNPVYWDGNVVWITPADYKTEDKYVSSGKRYISQEGYDNCSAIMVPANSIIFSKRAPIGTVAISKNELCTNQGCLSCVSKDNSSVEFYYYAMSIATEEFELNGSGTTFKEISLANFKNFRFAVPPLSEQQVIADYLDETCSKIDEIIAEAKASIDEYKELKQSVIFEAVTKGLDKNIEMKDSGVEWIGEIPNDAKLVPLKYLVSKTITDGTHQTPDYESSENGSPFLSSKDISSGKIDFSNIKYITKKLHEELYKNVAPQINDILLAKNGTTGVAALVETDMVFDIYVTLALIRPDITKVLPKYLLHDINCYVVKRQFDEHLLGIGVPNLHLSVIRNTKVIIHNKNQQKEIADFLDKRTAEIDSLIAEKESLINDLEAYKKSLIYEVVTGKRRVV